MIEIYIKNGQQYDYLSFGLNKKPSILTHIGIFSELVTLETLIKIKQKTSEKKYLEHVTSYLYNNPDKFKIYLINKKYNEELRLTIDTESDFLIAKEILNHFNKEIHYDYNHNDINNYVINNKKILKNMKENIFKNDKSL